MIADPVRRGRTLAGFYRAVTPRLFRDLLESGVLPLDPPAADLVRWREEWECFALYACVRGLVAAGGFNRETAAALDALHEDVLEARLAEEPERDVHDRYRSRVAERYAEYGRIGEAGGASGADSVTRRLGEAAARHMAEADAPTEDLAALVGAMHETLAEGAAEAVRRAE